MRGWNPDRELTTKLQRCLPAQAGDGFVVHSIFFCAVTKELRQVFLRKTLHADQQPTRCTPVALPFLNYIVDIHYYLALAEPIRTPLAALQVYLPMLGSSLLFGRMFQRSEKSSYDLGMNILGALFGGMLEYVSLIVGVQAVYLLALILFLAVIPAYRRVDLRAAS